MSILKGENLTALPDPMPMRRHTSTFTATFASLGAIFLLLLFSCGPPEEPRIITLGGPSNRPQAPKAYPCASSNTSDNPDLTVIQSVEDRAELSHFAALIAELEQLDRPLYRAMSDPERNSPLTLLVPSNTAINAFHTAYPTLELNDQNLRKLIRQHVFTDYFEYEDFLAGNRRLISVDLEEIPYTQTDGCVYVGENAARLIQVNDYCFRGVIHVINQVMIPKDGF